MRANTVVFALFSLYNKLRQGADVPEWEQAQEESATWHGEKD